MPEPASLVLDDREAGSGRFRGALRRRFIQRRGLRTDVHRVGARATEGNAFINRQDERALEFVFRT
jgi:hypothetical protein